MRPEAVQTRSDHQQRLLGGDEVQPGGNLAGSSQAKGNAMSEGLEGRKSTGRV